MRRSISLLLATGLVFAVVMFTLVARLGPDAGSLDPTPSRTIGKLIDTDAPHDDLAEAERAATVVPQAAGGDRTPILSDGPMTAERGDEVGELPFVELLVLEDRGSAGRAPIAGLKIVATEGERLATETQLQVGTTDARGRLSATLPRAGWFVFHPDPETKPAHVASLDRYGVSREAGAPDANGAHHFAPGERAELTLTLPAAGELVVSVRDGLGQPVVGARVELQLRSDLEERQQAPMRLGTARTHLTDEHGLVTLTSVPQGEIGVQVGSPAWAVSVETSGRDSSRALRGGESADAWTPPTDRVALPAPRRVRVEAGARTEVEVRLGGGEHELSGRVVDEEGVPLARVQVSVGYAPPEGGGVFGSEAPTPFGLDADALDVWTDAAGRFVATGLEPGPYRLRVQNVHEAEAFELRGSPLLRRVPTDESTESPIDVGDLVLPRPQLFVVRGRVVLTATKRNGIALDLTNVRPWSMSRRGGSQLHWSYDDETGEFTTACVLPFQPFQLRVGQWKGVEDYREYEFEPEAGVTLENVELRYP